MKVLYFGTYSKGEGYPRNDTIISGLRKNGVEVVECHYPLWKGVEEKNRKPLTILDYLRIILRVFRAYISLSIRFLKSTDYDLIIVGYTGQFDIFLVSLLNLYRKKPLVFDAFLSLFDTIIMDRKWFGLSSPMAHILWWLDRLSCKMADLILLDTERHIEYFRSEFGLSRKRFLRIFAGAEKGFFDEYMDKKEGYGDKRHGIKVAYFGTFIPLHGVDVIIKAAKKLEDEDIDFLLIGKGQELAKMKDLSARLDIQNLQFIDRWASVRELRSLLNDVDICLGAFGTTMKAHRVIPFKVFNCMALGKAIITGDTPASRELLKDGYNALLVPPGDTSLLVSAILSLKRDRELLKKLSIRARITYERKCTPEALGKVLLDSLARLCK